MNIESNKINSNKSAEELFTFLSNLANFEQLMPENTERFKVDGDSFLFQLKGMPEIRLIVKEKTAFSNITLGAASSKLAFTLAANITEKSNSESEVQLVFNGDFNPMMAMMVKKPLTKFIETLAVNLEKI